MSLRTLVPCLGSVALLALASAACGSSADSAASARVAAAETHDGAPRPGRSAHAPGVRAQGDDAAYDVSTKSLVSGGTTRTFILSSPVAAPAAPLPLVIALHWDGGSAAQIRDALKLEAEAGGAAVFAYPSANGSDFPYWDAAGRGVEAVFVKDLIASLAATGQVDTDHVFIAGMSGGATMTNALGCALGRSVIRGIIPMSGTLYAINGVYATMPDGTNVTACDDPAALLIWGQNDHGGGTDFATDGASTRDLHLSLQGCAATTQPSAPAPCVSYDACGREVRWCAILGMGHEVWASAGAATWSFVTAN